MRTIGLITATLLLFPSFLQQEMMPATNDPAGKPSLVKFTIPHAAAFSSPRPPKEQDIIDTTQLKQSNWFADASRNIEESEYEIKPAGGNAVFASPNRQQNLRAFYTAATFTLQPRENDDWKLDLSVKGIYAGKEKIYSPQSGVVAVTEKNMIRFTHNKEFTVEYINNKEGVRQNFIIEKQPASLPKQLTVKLDAGKDWLIHKVNHGEIHFANTKMDNVDQKITYNSLKAWDADNKELDAFFSVHKNEVSIHVNTENAAYPVTIDPLSTGTSGTPDWVGDDAGQPSGFFGYSVSSAGDVNGDGYSDVIMGCYGYDDASVNAGRAFVYYGSSTGLPAAPNAEPDDANQSGALFGRSVACAGDVNGDGYSDVIIGADGYDDGPGFANEGRVYLYYGSSTGLGFFPNAVLSDCNQAAAQFGFSVSGAGDINGDGYSDVIVGAYTYDDGGNPNEGKAFVYHGSAAGLITTAASTPDDCDQADAQFASSVSAAGDVNSDGYSDIVIGAFLYDDAGTDEGQAYVYYGSAAGLSAAPDLILSDANMGDAQFGFSVAAAGDVNGDGYSDVVIGANEYDDGANVNEGVAFIYYGSGTGLSPTFNAIADDANQANANFGARVACAGDVNGDGYSDVIIGSYTYDDNLTDEGVAFIYYGSSTGLSASPVCMLDDANGAGASFGYSVASAGDVNGDGYSDVIIGAYTYNYLGNIDYGLTYVYHGSPRGLTATAVTTRESNQVAAYMGSVAPAGDINADGYGDVIIGAYLYDNGETDEGVVYIYHGSPTGLSITPSAMLESNQASAILGGSCASAGDVNGDGYGDIIIGALDYTNGETNEGRAFVYHGSATGIITTPAATVESNQAFAKMGTSVAGAGDINGDGYGDIIVGAQFYTNDQPQEGRAFVYYGSPAGINTAVVVTLESTQASGYFGTSVAGAGDVNGDGYSDVIVGEYGHINGEHNEGGAFVYYGSAAGLNALAPVILEINQAEAYFGYSVAAAGDVNGDGYGDIIAGAFYYDNGETNEGAAFVFHGSATGITTTPAAIVEANQADTWMGFCVASAGDVNGDGYSDIIVGAPQYDNGQTDEGRAFVYHGSPTGINTTAAVTMESNQAFSGMAYFVAGAGDINADGYSDVLVGAIRYSNGELFEGRAFVYHGNDPGSDKRNNLRLYNSDLITPIQQANMAEPNLFGAGLFVKSPLGRQKGKMVWETVRNGTPFSGSPITNSTTITSQAAALTDLGLSGTELKHQIAKMNPTKATYVRARVKYDLTTAITGQVYGPWRYPEGFLRGRRDIGAVALPVKFISFTAVKQSANALLRWITVDETPGIQYEVQHSIDGINFTIIKTIQSLNNSRSEYEWLHIGPAKGMNYYRIRAVENNKDVFTAVRQLTFDNPITIQVYPNPVQSGQPFSVRQAGLPFTQGIVAELYDSKGQLVTRYEIPGGSNQFIFPAINLSAGQYQLKLINGQSMLHVISVLVIR